MRAVEFGEALAAGTRLTIFSDDKPDRFFRVIKFWLEATSGTALALSTGVPSYQVEDEEGQNPLTASSADSRERTPLVSLAARPSRI